METHFAMMEGQKSYFFFISRNAKFENWCFQNDIEKFNDTFAVKYENHSKIFFNFSSRQS